MNGPRRFPTRKTTTLALALGAALLILPSATARAQWMGGYGGVGYPGMGYGYGGMGYGGMGYGYGGMGYGAMGYGGMGYPGMGYGGMSYPGMGFGYGGMGYSGMGYGGGFGYGGMGYGGFGYGGIGSYTTLSYGGFGPGYANPLFGVGLTPLAVQSAITERQFLGRGGPVTRSYRPAPGYGARGYGYRTYRR